jgi:hypothetical protein
MAAARRAMAGKAMADRISERRFILANMAKRSFPANHDPVRMFGYTPQQIRATLAPMQDRKAKSEGYLDGRLLIAMPGMGDPRFDRSVIYMCAHSESGAMGIIINKVTPMMSFLDLISSLDIVPNENQRHHNE